MSVTGVSNGLVPLTKELMGNIPCGKWRSNRRLKDIGYSAALEFYLKLLQEEKVNLCSTALLCCKLL